MTAAGKPKKTINFKLFYSRAAKVFPALFVFSFFLIGVNVVFIRYGILHKAGIGIAFYSSYCLNI